MKLPTNYSLTNPMYIYLNVCRQMTDVKLLLLHSNPWNPLCAKKKKKKKKSTGLSKNVNYKMPLQIIYIKNRV